MEATPGLLCFSHRRPLMKTGRPADLLYDANGGCVELANANRPKSRNCIQKLENGGDGNWKLVD
jgi:hypothetical protein